jgi:hypothetical protein
MEEKDAGKIICEIAKIPLQIQQTYKLYDCVSLDI